MKLTRSFTLPEEEPVVPERLAERITDWFPHTSKVDVKRKQRNGWKVLTTIQLEGGEEPSDLYTMIKAYTDYDANSRGETGRYRALVWRLMPGDLWERRRVTFTVHPEEDDDDDDDEQNSEASVEQILQRKAWLEIINAQQEVIGTMADYNHRATGRLLEQSKQDSERLTPLSDVIHELVTPYREGLRMKADAVREVGELRVRQQLADAKANESSKFWEMFGPAIQVAAAQVHTRLGGGRGKTRALPAAAVAMGGTPVVQRPVAQAAAASPQSTPPSSPPSSSPPPMPTSTPAPMSLHELAAGLLHGLGADTMVRLSRMLDDDQAGYLEMIATATNDDDSAEAVVALMQSLMANPTAVIGMQQVLQPDELTALQQVAVLATRYLEECTVSSSDAGGMGTTQAGPPSEAATPTSTGEVASMSNGDA